MLSRLIIKPEREDDPTPHHTHSPELGILNLSKSVYRLYQQENFIFAFQIFVGLSSAFTILKKMSVLKSKRKIETF